ncbi:unnamed protein product [Miscanthus lutarioriparius]|uniref:F-box domain-containing protein n=1 Tax=Miscanthus lutarioriparius TaxID=422564 RepID=A0A811RGM1_9POAL|nr:unnamed protein product [Miscanthus lutarioriparius]
MELAAAGAPHLAVVANYGALPTYVLHDIQLRLPADKVCRLRLVCRSWRSLTSDPLFAAAHASRHPHVIVVSHHVGNHDEAEVRAVDLHDNVIKRRRIRLPANRHALGRLSVHGDLLCASHGCGLACVVDMVTGAVVADVDSEHQRKVNTTKPQCFIGHVPSTAEYKVLRIQVDYSSVTCDVVTLGGGGGGTLRWRRRPQPPVSLSIEPSSGLGDMAVVAGFAYFLVLPGPQDELSVISQDSIAVFDLLTEEWKPETLQGPLSSRGRSKDDEEEDDEPMPVLFRRRCLLRRKRFQLARLGENLVTLYCNV